MHVTLLTSEAKEPIISFQVTESELLTFKYIVSTKLATSSIRIKKRVLTICLLGGSQDPLR